MKRLYLKRIKNIMLGIAITVMIIFLVFAAILYSSGVRLTTADRFIVERGTIGFSEITVTANQINMVGGFLSSINGHYDYEYEVKDHALYLTIYNLGSSLKEFISAEVKIQINGDFEDVDRIYQFDSGEEPFLIWSRADGININWDE